MTHQIAAEPDRSGIEDLLPWYANGTLSAKDRARVEAALAADAELARRLELVREEMAGAILANEALPSPSPRALERLMAGIEAEPRKVPLMAAAKRGLLAWLSDRLSAIAPQKLAYAALAALALIAVQGAALTGVLVSGRGGSFETASAPGARTPNGSFVLLSFVPDARAADIAEFFKRHGAAVVDGPRANGFFKVQVAETALRRPQLDEIVERMKAERKVVGFVAPAN